uniref:Ig-like domain-containing protein n=1 Tax=Monopterus albus TaxID=43700 RepID=A0A3Q3J8C0_MONAL|nr:uncharacterized protein LOC109969580 isoform X1 [Monopterus albus]
MRWLLAGCCGLALISFSVALQLLQKPRFRRSTVGNITTLYCAASNHDEKANVHWVKADSYNSGTSEINLKRKEITLGNVNKTLNGLLVISNLTEDDSGVYFCKHGNTWGPGTQIMVYKYNQDLVATKNSRILEGLMIIQGLLLAVCIAGIMLHKEKLMKKRDSIYEDPETDHIYEGLAIETCGGGLYEELSVYAQAEGTEAPWE